MITLNCERGQIHNDRIDWPALTKRECYFFLFFRSWRPERHTCL
jgi:hypothetical protein